MRALSTLSRAELSAAPALPRRSASPDPELLPRRERQLEAFCADEALQRAPPPRAELGESRAARTFRQSRRAENRMPTSIVTRGRGMDSQRTARGPHTAQLLGERKDAQAKAVQASSEVKAVLLSAHLPVKQKDAPPSLASAVFLPGVSLQLRDRTIQCGDNKHRTYSSDKRRRGASHPPLAGSHRVSPGGGGLHNVLSRVGWSPSRLAKLGSFARFVN